MRQTLLVDGEGEVQLKCLIQRMMIVPPVWVSDLVMWTGLNFLMEEQKAPVLVFWVEEELIIRRVLTLPQEAELESSIVFAEDRG